MSNLNKIYFGAGCFWGVEELFRRKKGVEKVISGYMGGELVSPTYEDICTGRTGHAEVVEVVYNTDLVNLLELLKLFFELHDPTTPNQQDVNIGTQYRSAIFYTNQNQLNEINQFINTVKTMKIFKRDIITQIDQAPKFYQAEEYHQQYYLKKYHGNDGPICHYLRDVNWSGM